MTAVIADIVIATENENLGPLPVFTNNTLWAIMQIPARTS